jgi:hypothetical protein
VTLTLDSHCQHRPLFLVELAVVVVAILSSSHALLFRPVDPSHLLSTLSTISYHLAWGPPASRSLCILGHSESHLDAPLRASPSLTQSIHCPASSDLSHTLPLRPQPHDEDITVGRCVGGAAGRAVATPDHTDGEVSVRSEREPVLHQGECGVDRWRVGCTRHNVVRGMVR